MTAAAVSAVFTGMGVVAIRFVVTEWEPATLAFYRFTIASVTILPFLAFSRHARLERRDVLPVCVLGVAFFGLYPWVFGAGMVYIPASRGAVIFGAMPLATVVVAAALRLETLTRLKTLGAALAFGGSLGYFLWIWALQRSTPTRSSVFIALNPMTATLLGVLLLSEAITLTFILGLAGVIAGIVIANWQPGRNTEVPVE